MGTRFILLCLITSFIGLCKAEIRSFEFVFNELDYSIEQTESGEYRISSKEVIPAYPYEAQPEVPFTVKRIALPIGESIDTLQCTFNKRLIKRDIELTNVSIPTPTNQPLNTTFLKDNNEYNQSLFPTKNCTQGRSYRVGNFNVACLMVCPFVYDAVKHELYFIDAININLTSSHTGINRIRRKTRSEQIELLQSMVINPEDLQETVGPSLSQSYNENERIEYLIITSERFAESFAPLAEWKRKKGVTSKIVTVEDIYSTYTGRTSPIKIKTCIKDYYENHQTQFVLLGGDRMVVPEQLCFVNTKIKYPINGSNDKYLEYKDLIPADVYYSALDDIDWDTNGDGICGEPGVDSINVVPMADVTRASINTKEEAQTFVNRIIEYEQRPIYIHALLQSGADLDVSAQVKPIADKIYNDVFVGKVPMEAFQYFDMYRYTSDAFNIANYSKELTKGYQFVEVFSHGNTKSWLYNTTVPFYNTNYANILQNHGHTFITTTACETNHFDISENLVNNVWVDDPCLSEALMRNPRSGIVGFLGSSRYGWYYKTDIVYSMAYEQDFYERLFDKTSLYPFDKHFGSLVNAIKHSMLGLLDDPYKAYNWLHYSLNALGDPETPIFTSNPISFSSAYAMCSQNGILEVNAGVDGARICISSTNDNSFYEVYYGNKIVTDIGLGNYDIWITKQDYVPKHFTITSELTPYISSHDAGQESFIGNIEITSVTLNDASSNAIISLNTTYTNQPVKVCLVDVMGTHKFNCESFITDGVITADVRNIPKGIYALNLIVNNETVKYNEKLIIK